MSVVASALSWALQTAADDSHGYDQSSRWGADYDCSSFVISAFKAAGAPLSCTYTGNMRGDMLRNGFADVTASINLITGRGLLDGDVLLNHKHHTALYIGGDKLVQASINERGTTTGGMTGDQTGKEICTRSYYNYPWDCVLRYVGDDTAPTEAREEAAQDTLTLCQVSIPQIKKGATGAAVAALQAALTHCGYNPTWIDGDFGLRTNNMLMAFQAETGLTADGICGAQTWAKLMSEP